MSQSHTPWSSRHGSESPSLEVAVDVRRYITLELYAKNDDGDDCIVYSSVFAQIEQGLSTTATLQD